MSFYVEQANKLTSAHLSAIVPATYEAFLLRSHKIGPYPISEVLLRRRVICCVGPSGVCHSH